MRSGLDPSKSPEEQFESVFERIYHSFSANPFDTQILMREALDDQRSAAPPSEWFFKKFLDELTGLLDGVAELEGLSDADKLSRVYLLLSAIQFSIASQKALRRFYGEDQLASINASFPQALREQVRGLLSGRQV